MAELRTEQEIRNLVAHKLSRGFAEHIAGLRSDWPCTIALGRPSAQEILSSFDAIDHLVFALHAWEQTYDVEVTYAMREAGGPKRLPTHATVPTLDAAAAIASPREHESWEQATQRARHHHEQLVSRFPALGPAERAQVLRKTDGYDDLDFELLLSAGTWFLEHDAHGLTPREVPLPGIDAKWLDRSQRRSLVCLLAGRDELGLRSRPRMLELAYLDGTHLSCGGRRYDSLMEGDAFEPLYLPKTVVIVENKDTYLDFPQLDGGICIFGAGWTGTKLVSGLDWVRTAPRVVYWGDLDADGFEILDAYRARGLRCDSILMDRETLWRFERYGTMYERDHKTIIVRSPKRLLDLNDEELATYELLTGDAYPGNVRVEQEKIPLAEALRALRR